MTGLEGRMTGLEDRMTGLEIKVEAMQYGIRALAEAVASNTARIKRLEKVVEEGFTRVDRRLTAPEAA